MGVSRERLRPTLFLIKRGPRPEYHRAPYSPVIVCDRRDVADWEARGTDNRAWVWEAGREREPHGIGGGLLLLRWEGLVVDYMPVVHGSTLPDGTHAGFHHRTGDPQTWALFGGAVWWSERALPESLHKLGVVEAADEWTRGTIQRDIQRADWDRQERHGRRGGA